MTPVELSVTLDPVRGGCPAGNSRSGLARQPYWEGVAGFVVAVWGLVGPAGFFRAVAGDMGGRTGIAGRKVICPHAVGARIKSS